MRTFALRIFAIVAVLVLGLNAMETRHGLTNTQIKKIQNLKAGNTWGSLILSLAEMHTLAEGPIDDLVVAIEAIVSDLEAKLVSAEEEFDERTQSHNAEVRTLTDLINEAERNIADTQALIENVLVPQRNQLTEEIATLYRLIDETKAYITQTTTDRESAHSSFLERVEEHNEGIAAIQEALGVLDQLNEETSLIQLKKLHKSVEKIVKHVDGKHSVESAFVKSLLALTSSEFVNNDQVDQVRNLLIKVLGNLETSLTDE
jgi:vacuolar-type H+-ATPase subunit I/STV1